MHMKPLNLLIFLLFSTLALAQSADYPLNHPAYNQLDYWRTTRGQNFFTKVKPYARQQTFKYLKGFSEEDAVRAFNLSYLAQDSREWSGDSTQSKKPLGRRYYQYPADLYAVGQPDFDLHVNPVIQFRFGQDSQSESFLYDNTRGLEIRGRIDNKVAFYTLLAENQIRYPAYINAYRDSLGVIPQEGFWKAYGDGSTDFFRAQGYIDFGLTQHISAQVGYGRHFIGDGQRSLILSDFGNNYPYLRLETEVWRIKYTNLFAQLVGDVRYVPTGTLGTGQYASKYMAMHHLDINVRDNLNIGLFESVIFGEPDSLGGGFRAHYMNPIIFYRALEQQDGSPDNVLVGLDFNWHLWNRVTLYGQLVIDEMVVSEVFSGSGWWGNKQGYQLGAKYFNAFGIQNLMLQGEYNAVRPYMYAHESFYTNYAHYNQPLAHPLGANFREVMGVVDFQPVPRWRVRATGLLANYGNDQDGLNYGRDIFKPYSQNRPGEYNNTWLQGGKATLMMAQLRVSMMVKPNVFLDADALYRDESGARSNQSTIFGLSLRCNFPERTYLF
jgi:hypothetical protein